MMTPLSAKLCLFVVALVYCFNEHVIAKAAMTMNTFGYHKYSKPTLN